MTFSSDIVALSFVPVSEAGNWQRETAMSLRLATQPCARHAQFSVRRHLQQEFGPLRSGAKVLARLACCSPRTCERWLQDRADPATEHLVEMLSHPRFRDRFLAALDETRG